MVDDDEEAIIGQTIADVRRLRPDEKRQMGLEAIGEPPIGIILANGIVLIPMRDPEWNGSGTLAAIQDGLTLSIEATH